jgi:hypothetical protein
VKPGCYSACSVVKLGTQLLYTLVYKMTLNTRHMQELLKIFF